MASKLRAATVSIIINVILFVSKIVVAIITRSVGLFAECVHSLFDLFSSVLAFLGIKKAEEPDDASHLYGHEKFENLSSLLQALFIILTAGFIIYEAFEKLYNPVKVDHSEIGIILMVITIPITLLTSRYLSHIAKKEGGSRALEADSAHFLTDVLGSIAVLIGLVMVWLGYPIGDTIAAFAIAAIMLYIAGTFIKDAFLVFMDYTPDDTHMKDIKKVLDHYPNIDYHKLRARRTGNKILAEVHIQVDRKESVASAHKIAMDVKKKIRAKVSLLKDITIHVEPKTDQRVRSAKKENTSFHNTKSRKKQTI